MAAPYVGRYAPSPTGPLHLGNALTAYFAWERARQLKGDLLIRVEDLDTPRVVKGCEAQQLEDLAWLGFQSPTIVRQSERLDHYLAAAQLLRQNGRAYYCQCSRKQLQTEASAPHGPEGPIYPGTCRHAGHTSGALRFLTEGLEVAFSDAYFGRVHEVVADLRGDFVIQRGDGVFAYQLAVVVDDIAMGVTEVVRGADLLDSCTRQLCLYDTLKAARPAFAHVPLVLAANGEKLSKRNPSHTLAGLRASGISSGQILHWCKEVFTSMNHHIQNNLPIPRVVAAPDFGVRS